MRIYYLDSEYEVGKHRIMKAWSEKLCIPKPEETPRTTINVPYSVLKMSEKHNMALCWDVMKFALEGKYYIGSNTELYEVEDWQPMEVPDA